MTNRLNAAFAATLASAFSFAFVIAAMPLSALGVTGLAGMPHPAGGSPHRLRSPAAPPAGLLR